MFIGFNLAELQLQILAIANQHLPHGPHLCGIQVVKSLVAEGGIVGVAGLHTRVIFVLEASVEVFEEELIWVFGHDAKCLYREMYINFPNLAFIKHKEQRGNINKRAPRQKLTSIIDAALVLCAYGI